MAVQIGSGLKAPITSSHYVHRYNGGVPYIVGVASNSLSLEMYKGNAVVPTSFSEVDAANAPTETNTITQLASASLLDSATIHVAWYIDADDDIRYVAFDISSDSWGASEDAATDADAYSSYISLGLAVDSNDKPHLVYVRDGLNGKVYYKNKVGAGWSVSELIWGGICGSRVSIELHSDNTVHMSFGRIGTNHYIYWRSGVSGSWNATEDIELQAAGANGDAAMPLGIDTSGLPQVVYYDYGNDPEPLIYEVRVGGVWTPTTIAADVGGSATDTRASIAMNDDDCWVFYADDDDDVSLVKKLAGSWGSPVALEVGTYYSVSASMTSTQHIDYVFHSGAQLYYGSPLSLIPAGGKGNILAKAKMAGVI